MAVTVTYLRPAGTSAPTQKAVSRQCTVIALLSFTAATDTQVFVTHNLNISAADISQGFPNLFYQPLDPSFYTAQWYQLSQNPNYVMLGKTISVGALASAAQFELTIDKRNTIAR